MKRPQMFRWFAGRQATGYETLMLVWSTLLRLDCCLIRYPVGAYIPPHRDEVPDGERHYRLNIEIKSADLGGHLVCEHSILRAGPINLFRPDLALHQVTTVLQGTRYVFSIGWKRGKEKT